MPPPPTGFTAYGAPGPGVFKRVGRLGTALVALEAIGIVLTLVTLALQSSISGPAQDYLDGVISKSAFEDKSSAYSGIAGLSLLLTLATIVVGILWSYRIAGNLVQLGRRTTWKPGLTIVVWLLGACTLGIINFLMFREHDRASDPDVAPGDPSWPQRSASTLIPAWLGLTLVSAGLQIALGVGTGRRAINGLGSADSTRSLAESVANDLPLLIAGGILGAAATAVLVLIVRRITQRHVLATHES